MEEVYKTFARNNDLGFLKFIIGIDPATKDTTTFKSDNDVIEVVANPSYHYPEQKMSVSVEIIDFSKEAKLKDSFIIDVEEYEDL